MTLLVGLIVFLKLVSASDLGFSVGSKAASQLLSHSIHSALQSPRKLSIQLMSAEKPWFDPVTYVDTKARIKMNAMNVRFHDDRVQVVMSNFTLKSDSKMFVLPLPFFIGDDTAHLEAEVPYAEIRFKINNLKLELDACDINDADLSLHLENAFLMNYLLKPFLGFVPNALIHDIVCDAVAGPLTSLRNRFAIEIPLLALVPVKFQPFLRHQNSSLLVQLQSIDSRDEQLTLTARIDWNQMQIDEKSFSQSMFPLASVFDEFGDNNLSSAEPLEQEFLAERRMELWMEDRLFNEIMEEFDWDFEWMKQQIPVDSPEIPRSTREFLGVLCRNCYFELRVSAHGPPHLDAVNKTLILQKSDHIFLKVVNPTSNEMSVFISFYLNLTVQVIPQIENGVFRTQVNLLETSIRMEEGAFPTAWHSFVQDLVKGMIMDVIWPGLKKEIEALLYSDGVHIPSHCGLEPTSTRLYVDDNRFGVSASLLLDELSVSHCLRQLRSKLPDPSKLLVIKDI